MDFPRGVFMQVRLLLRLSPLLALPLLLLIPGTPGDALTFTVDTDIPDYIGTENITLNGTYGDTFVNVTDATDPDFHNGTVTNARVHDDRVELYRPLGITSLWGGDPVLEAGGVPGSV